MADRNSVGFMRRFDKGFVSAFNEKTLDHKKQKKVSLLGRKMFASVVYFKGLLYYYRALFKLFMVFASAGAKILTPA